jgi:hypothetical protein
VQNTCQSTFKTAASAAMLTLLALLLPLAAGAQTAHQKLDLSVKRVFTEGAANGGFFPREDIGADCLWGLMYLDLSNPGGRAQLALLINAKNTQQRLQRVDYHKDVPGTPLGSCWLRGLHIE